MSLSPVWVAVCLCLATAPAPTQAAESSLGSVRLGLELGGLYASNVFANASQDADWAGVARLRIDADWTPVDSFIVKGLYRGNLMDYRRETTERSGSQLVELTLGARLFDVSYLALAAGLENALYPNRDIYDFTGVFARASLRLELGDLLTGRLQYRLRHDRFPTYDLDNTSHQGEVSLTALAGDHAELELPLRAEYTRYDERFILDAYDQKTSEHRTGRRLVAEPRLRVVPSFATRFSAFVRGEINDSYDTFFYTGPFGTIDPGVNPTRIAHFDSYHAVAAGLDAQLEPARLLFIVARVAGGVRRYDTRPVFDTAGVPTGDLEIDWWLEPSLELTVRLGRYVTLLAAYGYARQWSNDPLWAYDAHRVQLTTAFNIGG